MDIILLLKNVVNRENTNMRHYNNYWKKQNKIILELIMNVVLEDNYHFLKKNKNYFEAIYPITCFN